MAAALAVFWITVVSLDPVTTRQRALGPYPDGVEYVDGAVNILSGNGYGIHLAGDLHPARYPFAYSYLLATWLAVTGDPMRTPYQVNALAGLLLLATLFWMLRQDILAAGMATLLTAATPAFVILCRSPMSEVPSTLLLVWGFYGLYRFAENGRWGPGAAGALALSLAVSFRFSNVLFAPFLPLVVLWRLQKSKLDCRGLVPPAAYGLGLLPLLAYNWSVFGGPLRTGYSYWLQRGFSGSFSHYYLPIQFNYYWQEFWQAEQEWGTMAWLYGEGSYYGPAAVILLAICWWIPPLPAVRKLFTLAMLFYLTAMLFYFFPDGRLVFPVMVCAIPIAALRLSEGFRSRSLAVRVLLLPAFLAALVGYPGRRSDTDLGDMWKSRPLRISSAVYELTMELRNRWKSGNLLVLSDVPPPMLHALLGDPATVAPLQNDHAYKWNPDNFFFEDPQREALLRKFMQRGDPIVVVSDRQAADSLPLPCRDSPTGPCRWRKVLESERSYLAVLDFQESSFWPPEEPTPARE